MVTRDEKLWIAAHVIARLRGGRFSRFAILIPTLESPRKGTQVPKIRGMGFLTLTPPYQETGAMVSTENPLWTALSPQRTDPSLTSPMATLYDDLRVVDVPAAESVSNIRSFMHSSSRIAAARSLRGGEAQILVDLIDQVSGAQLRCGVVGGIDHGCRPLRCQNWMGSFRNNAYTSYIRSAKLANCFRPRMFCNMTLCILILFVNAEGLRMSAKGSAWDGVWPSNASEFGRMTNLTRFSRYSSYNLFDNLPLLKLHIAVL